MEAVKVKFEKYPAYKDSGIEWLGEIPKGWSCIRMKRLYRDFSKKNFPYAELLSVTQSQGVVPRSWVENRMVMPSGALESFKFINKGDFAISLRSFEGGLEYCYHDGIVSPAYTVLKKNRNDLSENYYKYLFKSFSFISELQTSVVGIREGKNISYTELSYSHLPIPPLPEQTAIASFLDNKTAKIDTAIAQKEKMIALLKERKQIIIQNAVTGKVSNYDSNDTHENYDLKEGNQKQSKIIANQKISENHSSRPMKDSGVEWIGEIPEGWEVKPLRFIGTTQNGISAGAEYFGEGFPFVSYGDVYKNIELPKRVNGLAKSPNEDRVNFSVKEGDVFFTRTSETVEEIGFTSTCMKTIKEATFAGFLIRFRPRSNNLISGFSKFYFSSVIHRAFFVKEMNLVIRASLSQELLKKMPVLLPPLDEQNEIADYIETQSTKIDRAIALQQTQIEKLKEYKTILIDSAVTGKIKII